MFPSTITGMSYNRLLAQHYAPTTKAGSAKFWYHGLRNAFIAEGERDQMLPHALTKRLVNHAPPNDVTEGYAADWTHRSASRPRAEDRGAHRGVDEFRSRTARGG